MVCWPFVLVVRVATELLTLVVVSVTNPAEVVSAATAEAGTTVV